MIYSNRRIRDKLIYYSKVVSLLIKSLFRHKRFAIDFSLVNYSPENINARNFYARIFLS